MSLQRPNDPNRPFEDADRPLAMDSRLQADPDMREGRSSAGRIAIYGAAIAILLGAVFYGLNNSGTGDNTTAQAPATSTTSTADNSTAGAPVRDVTPNRESGMTTGAAPAAPVQPPQSTPTGQQVDRAKGPAQ